MQVEARCTPRAPLPTPAAGSLPLPAGLPKLKAAFEPRTIEDLNACQAEGTPPLAAQPDPLAPVGIQFMLMAEEQWLRQPLGYRLANGPT